MIALSTKEQRRGAAHHSCKSTSTSRLSELDAVRSVLRSFKIKPPRRVRARLSGRRDRWSVTTLTCSSQKRRIAERAQSITTGTCLPHAKKQESYKHHRRTNAAQFESLGALPARKSMQHFPPNEQPIRDALPRFALDLRVPLNKPAPRLNSTQQIVRAVRWNASSLQGAGRAPSTKRSNKACGTQRPCGNDGGYFEFPEGRQDRCCEKHTTRVMLASSLM